MLPEYFQRVEASVPTVKKLIINYSDLVNEQELHEQELKFFAAVVRPGVLNFELATSGDSTSLWMLLRM